MKFDQNLNLKSWKWKLNWNKLNEWMMIDEYKIIIIMNIKWKNIYSMKKIFEIKKLLILIRN